MKSSVNEVMELCLLAGKIMLTNGGETYRVEDTMTRIAQSLLFDETHCYVTPTGIFLTIKNSGHANELTKFIRISERSIDLNKVKLVNEISRKLGEGLIGSKDATIQLLEVEKAKHLYPMWLQISVAAIASGFFALIFGGVWSDYLPAFFSGGLGFVLFLVLHKFVQIKFFAEVLTAFSIGAFAEIFYLLGFGTHIDEIIIGSVMPLVPGVLITNAVRDLMAGHLVSGLSRGVESFLTAFAIGTGIAFVIKLF